MKRRSSTRGNHAVAVTAEADLRALADALGDTPETVGSTHLLRRGLCKAWIVGDVAAPAAAVVQSDFCPTEPVGFGADPELLWKLLLRADGWDCFLVSSSCAPAIAERMREHTGGPVRFVADINFRLDRPVKRFANPAVRLLAADDAPLLRNAAHDVAGSGYRDVEELLQEAIAAAAIVDGTIVSVAYTPARSAKFADIGVHTLEAFRRRGYAQAAASLAAQRVQAAGQTPVWSTGDFNTASLKLAKDLGFVEMLRQTYVVKTVTKADQNGC